MTVKSLLSLEDILLSYLQKKGSSTGYDIAKYLRKTSKHSHQQIYRTLSKMEMTNKVKSSIQPQQGKPDKKVYTLVKPYLPRTVDSSMFSDFSKTTLSYAATIQGIHTDNPELTKKYTEYMRNAEREFIHTHLR